MTPAQLEQQRLLAAAMKRLTRMEKLQCFDAADLASRPTSSQQEIIDCIRDESLSVVSILGGNQCLAKGTLVATPAGPVAIEDIKVGDEVYSENGQPIKVLKTFQNGVKPVFTLRDELDHELCKATENHVFLCEDGVQRPVSAIKRHRLTYVSNTHSYVSVSTTPEFVETYDIHVDSPTNLYCLANGLVTHNSGKSMLSMRILAWLFEETFPDFTRREKWGTEPLLILVVAQTLKQFEESLWRKMEPLLTDHNYTVQRVGGVINRIQSKTNGNTLLVFSHDNVNEARKRIQSFTAHVAVIDELPSKFSLIEETMRRLQAKNGLLLLPCTPKVPAPEIKRFIDGLRPPFGRRFKLKALDNPVYDDEQKRRILESTATMSEAMRKTVLEGDWMTAEEAVYSLNHPDVIEEPVGYHPSWRHVEASDPALSSKFGFLVAAQSPMNQCWYVVRADYIQDILVPQDMFEEVQRRTQNINLVRRISDPHETWYIQTAVKNGVTYMWPYDKARRKGELIKNLQTALGPKLRIAPWCTSLIEELTSASWSQHAEGKIANSSALHLNDCAQYLVDCLPKDEPYAVAPTWEAELRAANAKRKLAERQKQKQASRIQRRRR